jgi:single-strand DNA-binding protein
MMNKVILMGRLTKDVEVKQSTGVNPIAIGRYRLAVNRPRAGKDEQAVDFINIVAFGKSAEFAQKYFGKGQQVAVVGRLQVRNYEDNEGVKHTLVEVIADEQHFAGSKKSSEPNVQINPFAQVEEDEDLPF